MREQGHAGEVGEADVAGRRAPIATIVAVVVSALVATGALVAAATLRDRDATTSSPTTTVTDEPSEPVGPDGCRVEPCTVLGRVPVGGSIIELVADAGAKSGRLRIGGGTSEGVVFEVTITTDGTVTLDEQSLTCMTLGVTACLIRGRTAGGVVGQVVVGRSGAWAEAPQPFTSHAGYLSLADAHTDSGPEVLAVQYDCDRTVTPDCTGKKVFAQVFTTEGQELGCTDNYSRLESLPKYPEVDFAKADLHPCA
jgi:hypothetical protein